MGKVISLSAVILVFIVLVVLVLTRHSSVQPPTTNTTTVPTSAQPTKVVSTNDATMDTIPSQTGALKVGDTMQVSIHVKSTGQPFNAAQGTFDYSPNFTLVSLTPGNCNLAFVKKPTVTNPTFAGAILGGKSTNCSVLTVTLKANAAGSGSYSVKDASVLSVATSKEMLPGPQTTSAQVAIQ